MGDRGNIGIKYSNGQIVYLYTHWRGSDIPRIVHEALSHNERWDDEAYLARIVFETMISNNTGEFSGYGISPKIEDNQNPIYILDVPNDTVSRRPTHRPETVDAEWSFKEFASLTLPSDPDEIWKPKAPK